MHNGSYYIPREQIYPFFNPGSMNEQEGLNLSWETDPAVARRVLPPQLELLDPEHPVVGVYVVNITEPTFAPWYMEAGMYLLSRYRDSIGVYFTNLQLSGPGAAMGLSAGREFSGLPKKMCERIVVERNDDWARAFVESKGRRILDVEVAIDPEQAQPKEQDRSSCFLFQYETELPRSDEGPEARVRLVTARLNDYQSVTDYRTWEPATITSLTMEPSLDDPWAELAVVKPLGASYSISSNSVAGLAPLARFEGEEADALMPYLFSGRWDRSTISPGNQRFGQF